MLTAKWHSLPFGSECQHFYDSQDRSHPQFTTVKDLNISLLQARAQREKKRAKYVKFGDAVANQIINKESLVYYIGRIYQFLVLVSVNEINSFQSTQAL
jgi:glycyl-tRNA synthetase